MLKIAKLLKKNDHLYIVKSKHESKNISKYYPPSTQEWRDSLYTYNKNTSKLIPVVNNYIFYILKSYFNMFSRKMERKLKLPRVRRWKRRRYGRQLWISKPELKYSNNKIIINLYIYNRQYTFYLKKLLKLKSIWSKRLKTNFFKKHTIKNLVSNNKLFKDNWVKIFKNLEKKSNRFYTWLERAILFDYDDNKFNKYLLNLIINKYFTRLIQKILRYQIIYLRHKQAMLLNKFKFKDTYLIPLKRLLQKIYHKNTEFNIVSLKRFNLDSNILGQIVAFKMNIRKNRPLKVIKNSIRKSKVYTFNKRLIKETQIKYLEHKFDINNAMHKIYKNNNNLNVLYKTQLLNNSIENIVLSNTKNKIVAGIKVQASGRVTRRIIAQRAKCIVKYKGTLKDINSTYVGLPSVILKGHVKSTLQYTHIDYKRKIGSFGFKGWIGSY